jgi:hypothetical protein
MGFHLNQVLAALSCYPTTLIQKVLPKGHERFPVIVAGIMDRYLLASKPGLVELNPSCFNVFL